MVSLSKTICISSVYLYSSELLSGKVILVSRLLGKISSGKEQDILSIPSSSIVISVISKCFEYPLKIVSSSENGVSVEISLYDMMLATFNIFSISS